MIEQLWVVQWLRSIHDVDPWAIPILIGAGWSAGVAWGAMLWRRSESERAAEARVQRHILVLESKLAQYARDSHQQT